MFFSVAFAAFLLNHSQEYHLAVLFSCVEFWLELYFVPSWKLHALVRPWGLLSSSWANTSGSRP